MKKLSMLTFLFMLTILAQVACASELAICLGGKSIKKCEQKVVDEYNLVVIAEAKAISNSDISHAQNLAKKFNFKYPNIRCSVEVGEGQEIETLIIINENFNDLLSL